MLIVMMTTMLLTMILVILALCRELDQWVKKMKCDGSSMGLGQFSDIKVNYCTFFLIAHFPLCSVRY
jgi:hypothetical protein